MQRCPILWREAASCTGYSEHSSSVLSLSSNGWDSVSLPNNFKLIIKLRWLRK